MSRQEETREGSRERIGSIVGNAGRGIPYRLLENLASVVIEASRADRIYKTRFFHAPRAGVARMVPGK
jgi:hypothetical protein